MGTGPSDSLIAHKAINLCEDLSGSEKRVAAAIIDHYNRKTGQCDPGLGTIARLIGVSRRTVIRAVGVLAKKSYIRKQRHGGKFHRNQYEPNWAHFRAMEAKWNARRREPIRKPVATGLSPSERQGCHISDDTGVTQTLPRNSLKETLAVGQAETQTRTSAPSMVDQKELSREVQSKGPHGVANERFHVKSTSSRNAAFDAAEGRWNNSLTKQFKAAPDVFAGLIDAIDPDLHRATTETELRKPGSGLPFLLGELDRRVPPGRPAGAVAHKGTVPSGDLAPASNSDREGAAVSAEFQSLNITKHQA